MASAAQIPEMFLRVCVSPKAPDFRSVLVLADLRSRSHRQKYQQTTQYEFLNKDVVGPSRSWAWASNSFHCQGICTCMRSIDEDTPFRWNVALQHRNHFMFIYKETYAQLSFNTEQNDWAFGSACSKCHRVLHS